MEHLRMQIIRKKMVYIMDYFLNMTDCLGIGQLNGTDFRIVQETACYIFLCLLISSPSLNKSIFFQQSQEALPSVWAGQLSEIHQDIVEFETMQQLSK